MLLCDAMALRGNWVMLTIEHVLTSQASFFHQSYVFLSETTRQARQVFQLEIVKRAWDLPKLTILAGKVIWRGIREKRRKKSRGSRVVSWEEWNKEYWLPVGRSGTRRQRILSEVKIFIDAIFTRHADTTSASCCVYLCPTCLSPADLFNLLTC